MGRSFKAPGRRDIAQWAKVQALYEAGFRFFSYRSFHCPALPVRLSEVSDFIRDHPNHPMRVAPSQRTVDAAGDSQLHSVPEVMKVGMDSKTSARSTVTSLVRLLGIVVLMGALMIGLAALSSRPGEMLKVLFGFALSGVFFLVAAWSIRTGRTGARMLYFERRKAPIGFWLIVLFWLVLGAVLFRSVAGAL